MEKLLRNLLQIFDISYPPTRKIFQFKKLRVTEALKLNYIPDISQFRRKNHHIK